MKSGPMDERAAERVLDVVVADDDANDQMLFLLAAEESGAAIELTFTDHGIQTMDLLRQRQREDRLPHLLVLDLRMPAMDGFDVLDELRADPVLDQIPVVVLSTSSRAADSERAVDDGAHAYCAKPSQFCDLVDVVRLIIGYAHTGDYTTSAHAG